VGAFSVARAARSLGRWAPVLGGYVLAAFLAELAVRVRAATLPPDVCNGSPGMCAAGDGMLYVGVFGIASAIPSAWALYLLRQWPRFWVAASRGSLVTAATVVLAALTYLASASLLGALAVLRLLASPLLAGAFALTWLFCPKTEPRSRRALLVATAIEGAGTLYILVFWFVRLLWA
jgi:hypothetical protein